MNLYVVAEFLRGHVVGLRGVYASADAAAKAIGGAAPWPGALPWRRLCDIVEVACDEELSDKVSALPHLLRLLDRGCETVNEFRDRICHFCRCDLDDREPHRPDCPYMAAKAFLARPSREAVISTQQGDGVLYVTTGPKREPVPYDITLRLSAMPEVARLLEGLSKEINKSAAETIIQALVILKIIVDAGKEGKRVAITDQDLNVEREILIPGQSHDLA